MMSYLRIAKSFRRKFLLNRQERVCKSKFEAIAHEKNIASSKVKIAFEATEDIYYYIIFGSLISVAKGFTDLSSYQISTHYFSPGESKNLIVFFAKNLITKLGNRKWKNMYSTFSETYIQFSEFINPIRYISVAREAYLIWSNLGTKDTLSNLYYHNIWIGDLIIDTYLRFKPSPVVNLKDPFLLVVLWRAIKEVHRSISFFEKVNPNFYLTPYTTYVQHGIPTRVAISSGIQVFSFGNYQEFAKLVESTDLTHTKNCDEYASNFKKLLDVDQKISESEKALKQRLSGAKDPSLSYMRQSAYSKRGVKIPDVENSFIIFLHDFYDSPHVYKDMVFNDFWEWICFTIQALESINAKFFIKPHPNQIELSDEAIGRLKLLYPSAIFLSQDINNAELAKAGIKCAITVYGTVAHEMGYLGIPSISCAHHPHVSFDFTFNADSKEKYSALIYLVESNGHLKLWDAKVMKRQSLEFVYMHYLNLSYDERELLENLAFLRREISLEELDTNKFGLLVDKIIYAASVESFLDKAFNIK